MSPAYIIRPDELNALNFLAPSHPRPVKADWINRGTGKVMRRQSVDMLLRTMYKDVLSPSAVNLHRSAGLRLEFRSESLRLEFMRAFSDAKQQELETRASRLTMMFDEKADAADAAEALVGHGVPKSAISLLWRAGQFMDTEQEWLAGHSLLTVAGATAGGSIAGLAIGVALFAIPGVGQIAAIGGLAASSLTTTSLVSGIVGATAAAINKMMSDPDVEDVSLKHYVDQAKSGRVFVSIDLDAASMSREAIKAILKECRGRPAF